MALYKKTGYSLQKGKQKNKPMQPGLNVGILRKLGVDEP
jgi:hypothetical protein